MKFKCPCCGFLTLPELNTYEICPVCFWEDDGQNDSDADVVRGGPNYDLSLSQGRKNFSELGACEKKYIKNVRKPNKNEIP
jgi:hypothetical protein